MVAAATAGATFLATRVATAADNLAKMSDRLGVLPERLATLRHQARLSSVGVQQLDIGLQRMTRRISEAAVGTGEAQGALRELGLDAIELSGLSPDMQFKAIADAMAEVRNQGDRVRLAFKLFDSEGVGLLNTLKLIEGEGFARAERAAKRLGIAVDRDQLRKIEKMNDQWTRVRAALSGLALQLLIKLAPVLRNVGKELQTAFSDGDNFISRMEVSLVSVNSVLDGMIQRYLRVKNIVNALGRIGTAAREAMFPTFGETLEGGREGPLQKLRNLVTEAKNFWKVWTGGRSRMAATFGEGVTRRAESLTSSTEVLDARRTTPGRERDLRPVLDTSLGVLRDIRDRIGESTSVPRAQPG